MRTFEKKSALGMNGTRGWKLSLAFCTLFSLLASLLPAAPLHAQWAVTYDYPGVTNYANSVRQTSDGGFIAAGIKGATGIPSVTGNWWVMKLDAGGYVQWQKSYGGQGEYPANLKEEARSIQQTDDDGDGAADDGYIVAGDTRNFGAGETDIWVLKLDSSGNVTWEKTYGSDYWEIAYSIQQTTDGGYIVAGEMREPSSTRYFDIWVLKLDAGGNVQWQKSYGASIVWYHGSTERSQSIRQTHDGGYIVAGWINPCEVDGAGCYFDMWVLKLDADGGVQWNRAYDWNGGQDQAYSIQQTDDDADGEADDGYVVAGSARPWVPGVERCWVLKLDFIGDIQWQKTYEGDTPFAAKAVQQTRDGGYIVSGNGPWVMRLDFGGDIQWQKTYGAGSEATSIQQTSEGGFITTVRGSDFRILKLKQDGSIDPSCDFITDTSALAVDSNATTGTVTVVVNDTEVIPQTSEATVLDTTASPEFLCQGEEEQCTNGTDDDGDGLADCNDPECCDDPACFGTTSCKGISETLVSRQAVMDDAVVSGDLSGALDFSRFETVSITTGAFAGKGFSTGECTVTLEGTDYTGEWKGVLLFDAEENRILMRGAVSGGIHATVEGSLSESASKNSVYDRYEATWSIGRLGAVDVSSIINVQGTLSYQGGTETTDTNLYVLQDNLEATDSGDYGDSLNMVLTHLRVVDPDHPHKGEGFSLISYNSGSGSGVGWMYDERVNPGVVEGTGLFSDPLFGIVSATLDETSLPRSLDLSIERVDLALPPMPDLRVSTWGPTWVSAGQTTDLTVAFSNNGADVAEEVVVVLELQGLSRFVSCTGGGIYRWQTHEVFWNLGTLAPGETGLLSAKVYFPWGLEGHSFHPALAHYVSASTDKYHYLNPDYEDLVDPQELLDYQPLQISSSELLAPEDFGDLFESDEKFRQLHEDSMGQGFTDASALKMATSEGPVSIVLMGKEGDKTRFIIHTEDESMIMEMTEKEVSFFDRDVGIAIDPEDGTTEVWGEEGKRGALQDTKAIRACLIPKYCIDNCVADKIPGWLLSHYLKYGVIDNLAACGKCVAGQGNDQCGKCAVFLTKIPLLGQFVDILKCAHECRMDPGKYCCTEDKRVCKVKWTSSREYYDVYKCDQETGLLNFFAWSKECGRCEKCVGGRCVPRPGGYCSEPWNSGGAPGSTAVPSCGKEGSKAGVLNGCPYTDSCTEVLTAHDPNVKYGPAGPVAAGQTLDYKLEFENEGEGTAFGVYFTDTLDTDLDDTTLEVGPVRDVTDDAVIGPEGTYDPQSRTVTWFAGEVAPDEGGYAEVSIDVRSDAPRGTEIINYGTVYFPSVPEETRTNAVVSVIPVEICDDEVDNDEDSLTDCEDPDCFGPGCQEVCDDVMDNDGDSFADCADTDCPACSEICTNGLDDNRDDLVDCDDPACAGDPACAPAATFTEDTGEGGCGCAVFGTSAVNPFLRFVVTGLIYLLPVAFIAFQRRRLRLRSNA